MAKLHILRYEANDLAVEIRINDVPIDHVRELAPTTNALQLNMWLRPGANTIRVRSPIPPDRFAANAAFSLSVHAGVEGEKTEELPPIATWAWPPRVTNAPLPALDETVTFMVDAPPPTELWRNAQPLAFDERDRAEIRELVGRLRTALVRKDPRAVAQLVAFKTDDLSRALYLDATQRREEQVAFFSELMSSESWAVSTLPFEAFAITPCGEGKIAWVSRQGEPALVIDMGDADFALPIYVARIEGLLRIVR